MDTTLDPFDPLLLDFIVFKRLKKAHDIGDDL